MLTAFLIFLREGLEGSMIVAILLAYLRRVDATERAREVWGGVAAAICVAVGGGIVAYLVVRNYDGSVLQTWLEGITYAAAAAILTYMTFWMKAQARSIKHSLEAQVANALSGQKSGGFALAGISFLTVAREGLETVVFTLAIALSGPPIWVVIGAAAGLGCALLVSWASYRLGLRMNMGRFFSIAGTLLMVSAAGLLADAIENFQVLGVLPGAGHAVWSTAAWLSESSFLGDLLHTFFGYAAQPTALQLGVYIAYLAAVLAAFLKRHAPPSPRRKETVELRAS